MPRTARDTPPPLELLCLNALWSIQEGNVKAVQTVVARSRPLAYTTIMTVLERLVRKGRLKRRKMGRSFLYSPESSRDAMRRAAVRELVDGYFDGSEKELLRFLAEGTQQAATAAAASAASDGGAREVGGAAEEPIDTVLL